VEAKTATEKRALMWTASEKRAKAMADEKRAQILQHLVEEGVKAASEISNELRLPLNSVSYHCGKLVEFDCIEAVRTEVVRGGNKTYYRAIDIDFVSGPDWQGMEDARKPGALLGMMAWPIRDFDHAMEHDTFGDDGRWHIMRNPLKAVDQQALDDLLEAHMELYQRSVEIQREAAERLKESGEAPIRVSSSSQCFRVESFGKREKPRSADADPLDNA
jgi:DNA-binding transcriptional ArsR family regulator